MDTPFDDLTPGDRIQVHERDGAPDDVIEGKFLGLARSHGEYTLRLQVPAERWGFEEYEIPTNGISHVERLECIIQQGGVMLSGKPMLRDVEDLMRKSHQTACEKGWWDGPQRPLGDQFANFHAEISEAWEEIRANRPLDEIRLEDDGRGGKKPEGVPVELADLLIRVFDTCQAYGIPLLLALHMKMEYNETRPYRHGGKAA